MPQTSQTTCDITAKTNSNSNTKYKIEEAKAD